MAIAGKRREKNDGLLEAGFKTTLATG